MGEPIILVVGDIEGDPALRGALACLVDLSAKGLLHRFWFVDAGAAASESVATTRVANGETDTDALFRSMASIRKPSITRVVSILTAAATPTAVERAGRFAEGLQQAVRRLQPPGAPLKSVRLVFPESLGNESILSVFLDSHADANLIAVPEDRASDLGFAAPVTVADIDSFSGHVAAEIATQVGLWISMSDAPVDTSLAGVIDGNEVPVHFVRSYARAAIGPPLPLYEAMITGDSLPVPASPAGRPNTLQASPNQWASARDFADQLHSEVPALQFEAPDEFDPGKLRADGVRGALRLYGSEVWVYLRGVPKSLYQTLVADTTDLAGEALLKALGDQSRIEVDWVGRDLGGLKSDTLESHIRNLTAGLNRRRRAYDLESVESTPIDQAIWDRVVRDVSGAVDAGDDVDTKLQAGDITLVISDPKVIGPDPSLGLEVALRALNSEGLSPSSGTLLGRFAGRIRGEIQAGEENFKHHEAELAKAIEDAETAKFRSLPFLTWSIGGLLTLAVTALVLGFGAARTIGIDTWSQQTRYLVGLAIAAVWIGAAAICLAAAQRMIKSRGKWIPWGVCGGILLSSGIAWVLFTMFASSWTFIAAPVQELAIIGSVIACLVIALITAVQARTAGHRTTAKLIGILLMSYVSIALIGVLVRINGWLPQQAESTVRSICLKIALSGVALAFVLFGSLTYFRVRDRLSLNYSLKMIQYSAESARFTAGEIVRLHAIYQQYLGTALALNRVLQMPFGGRPPEDFEPPSEPTPFPAYKVSLHYFLLEGKARMGALARIRRLVAERGWILRQYRKAAEAFVPEFAFQTGRDPDEIDSLRPEIDQTVGKVTPDHTIPASGPRWRFAEILNEGGFDADLERAGVEASLDDALTKYLTPNADSNDEASLHLGILEHGLELVSGERPVLAPEVFRHMELPTAGDRRAQFETTVWWPTVLTSPDGLGDGTKVRAAAVDRSDPSRLVIEFVRSDWSLRFPLSSVPLGAGFKTDASKESTEYASSADNGLM
jgi:hypothetical protein